MNIAAHRPNPFGQCQQILTCWHFLSALALLALNDHVLKQAGVLPPWLTGKLSDFAGLYVAPVLLCTVLRQESRRALACCTLITGAVFTTLELSPLAARAVEQWTQTIGFPWRLTCDVTDLLALPMLWLGYRVFSAPAQRRVADGNAVRVRPSLRWHERVIAALATLACAATSRTEEIGTVTRSPVIVNGSGDNEVELRIQVLREDIVIDCAAIEDSPGEHLPRSAFGPITHWSLGPLQTLILDRWSSPSVAGCSILLVEIAGRAPTLFFWQSDRFEPHESPWQLTPEQVDRVAEAPQYVTVLFNAGEAERFKDNADLAFSFEPRTRVDDACEPSPVAQELWTPFNSYGVPLRLASKRYAADGCFELTFDTAAPPLEAPEQPEPPPSATDTGTPLAPNSEPSPDAGAAIVPANTPSPDAGTALLPDDAPDPDAGTALLPDDAPDPDAGTALLLGDTASADAGTALLPGDGGALSAPGVRWRQQNPMAEDPTFWLCLPEQALPFETGDELTIEANETQLLIERDRDGAALRVVSDGTGTVSLVFAELTQVAESDCALRVFEEPTLTTQRSSVRVSTPWGAATLKPGEQQWLHSDTHDAFVGVIEARRDVVGNALLLHSSGFLLTLPATETAPANQDLSSEKAGQL